MVEGDYQYAGFVVKADYEMSNIGGLNVVVDMENVLNHVDTPEILGGVGSGLGVGVLPSSGFSTTSMSAITLMMSFSAATGTVKEPSAPLL